MSDADMFTANLISEKNLPEETLALAYSESMYL